MSLGGIRWHDIDMTWHDITWRGDCIFTVWTVCSGHGGLTCVYRNYTTIFRNYSPDDHHIAACTFLTYIHLNIHKMNNVVILVVFGYCLLHNFDIHRWININMVCMWPTYSIWSMYACIPIMANFEYFALDPWSHVLGYHSYTNLHPRFFRMSGMCSNIHMYLSS